MQQLGQYVLSLTATAMICAVLLSVFRDGTVRSLLRIFSGSVLIIITFCPMLDFAVLDSHLSPGSYVSEGKAIAATGADLAGKEKERRIQRQLEAYILDKAEALGTQIRPEVYLDDYSIPVEVKLYGQCSDSVRQVLTAMITNDLGIPEEDQKWTGQT